MDRHALHALGVLVPIRFHPIRVLPGRHPLGRPGDGMRLLRTRPYVPGEDNPRDIDKFSPPDERRVMEWEDEAQASISILVDNSASMASPLKRALRNACVLQMTYSLWRAGDRVGVALFDTEVRTQVRAANLRAQMQQTIAMLRSVPNVPATDISASLNAFVRNDQRRHSNLLFVVSDFLSSAPDGRLGIRHEWRSSINEQRRNIVPVVVSFRMPAHTEGLVKVWDPERRARRLSWFDGGRVRLVNEQEAARVSSLTRAFRSAGLDSLELSNQQDIYPQLAHLARVRRQRRN